MELSDHTVTVASIICVGLILVAGCTTSQGDTQTTTVETTEIETSTLEKAETTTEQQTTTNENTKNLPYELRVANYGEEKAEVDITIQAENGTNIYNSTVIISGNSTKEFNLTFPETGSYNITANTTTSRKNQSWNVKAKDPAGAASIVITKDGELHVDIKVI